MVRTKTLMTVFQLSACPRHPPDVGPHVWLVCWTSTLNTIKLTRSDLLSTKNSTNFFSLLWLGGHNSDQLIKASSVPRVTALVVTALVCTPYLWSDNIVPSYSGDIPQYSVSVIYGQQNNNKNKNINNISF